MASSGANKLSRKEWLDQYFFFKRWYAFFSHFIPFAVAALLLLVLSLPSDNLLAKLATKLNSPGSIWVPAILLTLVAWAVHIATMYVTIRQAYLWPNYEKTRTILTSLSYEAACTLLAGVVLATSVTGPFGPSQLWASFLLAILSLTGLGWSLPSKWVDSLGVTLPDYTGGRQAVEQLVEVMRCVRQKITVSNQTTLADCQNALKAANDLHDSIEANLLLEPTWARPKLEDAMTVTKEFADELDSTFVQGDEMAQQMFGQASNLDEGAAVTKKYRDNLRAIGAYWPELLPKEKR